MIIYGIDFTSSPSRKKPITCLECEFVGSHLTAGKLVEWPNFGAFEQGLQRPGPWVSGIDFPFGQARRFIETIGWPQSWQGYVTHAANLGKAVFERDLDAYAASRPEGDKHHFRLADKRAKAQSPQKLHFVPVGKMFFQGAPRLIKAGVTIPGLYQGDPERIVVEAYPGVLARYLIGYRPYKAETRKNQTTAKHEARRDILRVIESGKLHTHYGLSVSAPITLADDPTGDHLDTLLCAIQAAWAWTKRDHGFGEPKNSDPLEGWIADPMPFRT
jgi:hypothetical protein